MNRAFEHRALALAVRASGESNREAVFLTADSGLIRAMVFGGPKSKLRAAVGPFHGGILHVYRDPVRDSRKITEFDVQDWRPGLREGLERSFAAQAIAETIIASHGGGGAWEEALELASDTLDALDIADGKACRSAFVRFLWKWTEILGMRPDLDECGHCACTPRDDEVVWYSGREGSVECGRCSDAARGDAVEVGPGGRSWLRAVDRADARSALRIDADEASLRQARHLVFAVAVQSVGERLKTWNFLESI